MADELTVKVVSGASESLHLRVDLAAASVLSLKQLIEQQDARRFPVAAQRLIFQGQILQDDKLLADYHVAAGCALHLTLTPGAVAAANAAADRPAAAAAPAGPAQLRAFLLQMRDHEPHEQYATAARTLQKICANIVGHPTEEKYRKLRVDNAALKAKLFDRTRGQDCVKLLGFQDGVQAVRADADGEGKGGIGSFLILQRCGQPLCKHCSTYSPGSDSSSSFDPSRPCVFNSCVQLRRCCLFGRQHRRRVRGGRDRQGHCAVSAGPVE
ncbi:hypothetical protein PHYSODRAFT_249170, partial [Phytophthora sojae]